MKKGGPSFPNETPDGETFSYKKCLHDTHAHAHALLMICSTIMTIISFCIACRGIRGGSQIMRLHHHIVVILTNSAKAGWRRSGGFSGRYSAFHRQ